MTLGPARYGRPHRLGVQRGRSIEPTPTAVSAVAVFFFAVPVVPGGVPGAGELSLPPLDGGRDAAGEELGPKRLVLKAHLRVHGAKSLAAV